MEKETNFELIGGVFTKVENDRAKVLKNNSSFREIKLYDDELEFEGMGYYKKL